MSDDVTAILSWVATCPAIDPHSKALLLAMLVEPPADGWRRVSTQQLQARTALNARTIRARLDAMAESGVLLVCADPRSGAANAYQIRGGVVHPMHQGGSASHAPPSRRFKGGGSASHALGGVVHPMHQGGSASHAPPPSASHAPPPAASAQSAKVPQKRTASSHHISKNMDQDQDQDQIEGAKRRKATVAQRPPTEPETRAIMVDLGCPEARAGMVAAKCYSYWSAQGWQRKGGPIRDWRQTCRTWLLNEAERDPRLMAALSAAQKPGTAQSQQGELFASPAVAVTQERATRDDWSPDEQPDSERAHLWREYLDVYGARATQRAATSGGYPSLEQLRGWKATHTAA